MDVCGVSQASILPVAKYYIKDYGKVGILDSAALMAAVVKGPVALGMDKCVSKYGINYIVLFESVCIRIQYVTLASLPVLMCV